jgi:Tfp pilus assembly protein PilN
MPPPDSRPPSDYRRYRRQTERNLVIAVVTVLVLVGSGLVLLIYGRSLHWATSQNGPVNQ